MSHATDVYGGAFSFLMGHQSRAASDEELARLDAMVDAQDALDGALDQACSHAMPARRGRPHPRRDY